VAILRNSRNGDWADDASAPSSPGSCSGGDLYTAYTFIAVPTLMFGSGAIGFFAVPYTIFVYPILFAVFPRLWSVSRAKGYVTAADFVRGRFGNRPLALAVAVTGIVATMPYIALQLVGMEVVIGGLGIHGELPLVIAFVILAAYTYSSGLRAPAMIAVVKDMLIYITVVAALIVIPHELGGYAKIFASVPPAKLLLAPPTADNLGQQSGYARWRSARRSRCFSIRMPSPACSVPRTAMSSSATPSCCRPIRSRWD
jgi:SSS family solute:Na+ symporter